LKPSPRASLAVRPS